MLVSRRTTLLDSLHEEYLRAHLLYTDTGFMFTGSGNSSMAKQRLDWLDIAKGIAILLVIVGHTVNNPSIIRQVIFSFHMPFFFILAGYTFRIKPWGELLKTSCARLLVPYMLIVFAWKVPMFLTTGAPVTLDAFAKGLGSVFFASGTDFYLLGIDAVGMSWFLVALFLSRIILNVLMIAFERFDVSVVWQALACIVLAFCGISCSKLLGIYLPLDADLCCYTVFLMWCGHMMRVYSLEPNRARWFVVLGIGLVWVACMQISNLELAARHLDNPLAATVGALAGTYFVCWVSTLIEKLKSVGALRWLECFLVFCGKNSMAIFCIHAIDWMFPWQAMPFLKTLPFSGGIASALRCAADVSISYVVKKA